MRKLTLNLALTLVLGATVPSLAAARDGNSPEGQAGQQAKEAADLSLEELANVEVYSASKHRQSVSDAPSSVTIVTADEIEKFGYRTLADVLRSVPGFYVTYDRNYSFVGVRGFGRLGDWNSRILLLVDGHRLNNNTLGEAMLGTEFPVDVDLIDRVEIVRGPSSSLYGSNAFFAVINVITRKSSQLKGWELSFEPGSFETYKGRASYGGRYQGTDIMLSGTFYDSQGQTLFFPEFNTPATHHGIARNADDEVHEHMLATISFRGFTLQGVFSAREKGVPNAYFGTVFNDRRTRNFDDHQYFDLTYQHSLGERWQVDARTSYDQYRLQAPLAVASPTPGGPVGVDQFSSRGNWWTGEVRLSRTLWEKHKLTFGSEFRDNRRQDQGNFSSASSTFEQDLSSAWSWGLYAQDDYAITRKLTLSAGIRHDRYPRGTVVDTVSGQAAVSTVLTSFGGTTNPRLGLIYHPYEKTTFKLLYGSAFRAPEVYETAPDLGSFVGDNLRLKPETIKSFEVVAEQRLGQHFKLSGSVYHNRVNRLITLQPDAASGLLIYANSESVQATGSEIEFTGRFSGGLQGTASLSLVDADNSGPGENSLSNSPSQMVKINVSIPLAQRRLFGGLEGQYLSPRTTLAGNTVGAFQVFNVTLLGHGFGQHLDISASLYNFLNKKYADPGRPEDPEDAIRQDGITFRIKTTVRF
jgi:iron complex outermembrane receptor protein